MKTDTVIVDACIVPDGHRAVDPEVVDRLAESMARVGLLHPILVHDCGDEAPILISGRHRLEAAKKLEWDFIDGILLNISDAEARMREITENLHRSELTALERATQIEEWRLLCEEAAKVTQVVSPSTGGKQPKEKGVRKVAKELGISQPEVQRAVKIAGITPKAKAAAVEAGIDDNQSKLLKVAQAEPEEQVSIVHELAEKKARKRSVKAERMWKHKATRKKKRQEERQKMRALETEQREIMAVEIERAASKLIDVDRDGARAIHDALSFDDRGAIRRLRLALARGLGIEEENDDGTAAETPVAENDPGPIPACLLRDRVQP